VTQPTAETPSVAGFLPAVTNVDERVYGCTVYAMLTKLAHRDVVKHTFYSNAATIGGPVGIFRSAGATLDDNITELFPPDRWLRELDWTQEVEGELLADNWERETSLASTFRAASGHPAFRGLERMGTVGTAIALRRLRGDRRPLWLGFLSATTGENPVRTRGNVKRAAEDWLDWGRERLSGHAAVAD
jgi:hypothetical protein